MLYNVAQLLKAPVGADLRAPIEGALKLDGDEATIVAPITGDVRFQRTNQGILATGDFETTVQMQCVRCIDTFEQPIHIDFSELYMPTVEVLTGHPLPHVNEEEAFPIDAHHHLDLAEMIRQQIVLALPMQPLCREDCAGLCPVCGKNRNVDPCDCVQQEDVRWNALAGLKLEDIVNEESEN